MENIFLINKFKEWTSNDVVQFIKKKCKFSKVGHAGTLDPNATGLLILGVNSGTKKLASLILDDKQYIATIKFGILTDTGDITGNILEKKEDIFIDKQQLINNINTFLDNYLQVPHKFSAVKINGKKAYEYARENLEIKIEPKKVNLYSYEIKSFDEKTQILKIQLDVSKGFYVRSFAVDLAKNLNNIATLLDLERVKCGNFDLKDSLDVYKFVEKIKENNKI